MAGTQPFADTQARTPDTPPPRETEPSASRSQSASDLQGDTSVVARGVPVSQSSSTRGSAAQSPGAPAHQPRPVALPLLDVDASDQPLGTIAAAPLRAASSVVARSHTVVDVLHARALKPYVQGLRAYLTIRLADADEGDRALRRVRAVIAAIRSEDLVQAPGIRARLYRIAREVAELALDERDGPIGSPPWAPGEAGKTRITARVEALRDGLEPRDAELLELRHTRELTPEDLAYVLELDVQDVLEDLHFATCRAAEIVHLVPGEKLRNLLVQAFTVVTTVPTTREEEPRLGPSPLGVGSLVADRYRIQLQVGTGAFGDVYRAEDVEVPGHVVALKILHQPAYGEEERQSALRELRHLASVFHPSVVHLKDHGWFESRLWFVMPWYDGETLESRIRRGPLTRAEARTIFEPLARALAAVHAAGLRHQDVKPENVFLAELPAWGDGSPEDAMMPVLIDLGVAATQAEMLVAGTPTYFAPEVAAQFATVAHRPRVTEKADVFSLVLAMRNALEPDTQEDVGPGQVDAFIETRARDMPLLPRDRDLKFLKPHLQRWMSLDPDERPTALELADQLSVLTAPEDKRRRRRRARRRAFPILMMLAGLGVAAVEVVQARDAQHRDQVALAVQEAEAVREDLAATDAERRRIAQDAEAIRGRLASERLGRTQLESRLAGAEATLSSLRGDLTTVRGELTSERQAHEADVDARQQIIARLEAETTELQERRNDLTQQLRTGEEAQAELQRALNREREGRAGLEAQVRSLTDRVAAAEAGRAGERARRAAADARADSLEEELTRVLRTRERSASATPAQAAAAPVNAPMDPPPFE